MATATAPTVAQDVVTLLRIQPGGLDHYCQMVGPDGGNPRIKCYDGSMLLVSPSGSHESAAEQLDSLIESVCFILRISFRAFASTFYRTPGQDKGIEPDKSYYIQNIAATRAKKEIDLAVDPPPDLIVEVVVSNSPAKSLAFCRDVGVPEFWLYDVPSEKLSFLVLRGVGTDSVGYHEAETSLAFPFLTPGMVLPWLTRDVRDQMDFLHDLHDWVAAELAPRVQGRPEP